MVGRRWSDGLHQAVEAKEGVTVEGETQTFATITLQNYFRLYDKRAGMTGTAETEASEFWEIYKLDVVKIPTHRPIDRRDYDDFIFRTRREKYNAIVEEVAALQKAGRPVLVGTTSVDVSETLSRLLKRRGIRHNVLNAKHHQHEAEIVSRAGEWGAVTIATNMAGRGTDIKLGAKVLPPDKQGGAIDENSDRGLAIIGSERHESRRIDRQLRGRAGRQGDPGTSRFFLSLEDDLMRLFRSDRVATIMERLGAQEGEVIEHRWVTRAVENAQKKVEQQNFSIRKRLLEYDDVMNRQREVIYGLRDRVLAGESMRDELLGYLDGLVENEVGGHATDPADPISPDALKLIAAELELIIVSPLAWDDLADREVFVGEVTEHFKQAVREAYGRRENDWGERLTRWVERQVMLGVIDEKWRDHLYEMDMLKEGIGFRAYAQKDPLIEYKREAFGTFETMMESFGGEVVRKFFRAVVVQEPGPGQEGALPAATRTPTPTAMQESHAAYSAFDAKGAAAPAPGAGPGAPMPAAPAAPREPVRGGKKVGRNDPCPCGSGKKYKKCHGAGG
jgi:preprotein translocase subunit SecA